MQLTFIIKSFQDLDAGFMSLKLQNVGMGGVGMCILQDWSMKLRNHIEKRKPVFHINISIPVLPRAFIRWYFTQIITFLADIIHRKSQFHYARKKLNG